MSRHPPKSDLQLFAAFFQAAGNIIPLYYLATYATYVLGISPTMASMLLAVNNGVNSIARIAMGLIADHVGRQNTLVGCVRSKFHPQIVIFPSNCFDRRSSSLVYQWSRSGFTRHVNVSSLS